jgi:hypothetical protein
MASLTSYTDTTDTGRKIIEPPGKSPGFLGGLASLASSAVSAYSHNEAQASEIQELSKTCV